MIYSIKTKLQVVIIIHVHQSIRFSGTNPQLSAGTGKSANQVHQVKQVYTGCWSHPECPCPLPKLPTVSPPSPSPWWMFSAGACLPPSPISWDTGEPSSLPRWASWRSHSGKLAFIIQTCQLVMSGPHCSLAKVSSPSLWSHNGRIRPITV